jgi:dienelactone hydrolase
MDGVFAYLRGQGVQKSALVGFCWGGWVVAHVLGDADYSAGGDSLVSCGASPHPSIIVEGWVFQKPNGELMSKIKKPMLLLPAGMYITH